MHNAEKQVAKWQIIAFMAVTGLGVVIVNVLDAAGWLA